MASIDEKFKHSKRLKRKRAERVRSVIAKELITSGKYSQRVVKDKRGKQIITFRDLIDSIQDE